MDVPAVIIFFRKISEKFSTKIIFIQPDWGDQFFWEAEMGKGTDGFGTFGALNLDVQLVSEVYYLQQVHIVDLIMFVVEVFVEWLVINLRMIHDWQRIYVLFACWWRNFISILIILNSFFTLRKHFACNYVTNDFYQD